MDSLNNFFSKFGNSLMEIHPLTYGVFFGTALVIFFILREVLKKYSPKGKKLSLRSGLLTIFVGLPVIGILSYLIIFLILYKQPF